MGCLQLCVEFGNLALGIGGRECSCSCIGQGRCFMLRRIGGAVCVCGRSWVIRDSCGVGLFFCLMLVGVGWFF